jgi:hypothetical protein
MKTDWILFVETTVFTKRVRHLGLEEPLRALQIELVENPATGDVDAGTGGLRKVRIPDPVRNKGKRGGGRVHYLWIPNRKRIYLLFLYTKDELDSLSKDQKKALKKIVDQIVSELQ